MKTIKNLEFRRFRKDKDSEQQHPTFFSGSKVVYAIRSDVPVTEKEFIREWKLIGQIERAKNWTNSVQQTLDERKDVLTRGLMEMKRKESENE